MRAFQVDVRRRGFLRKFFFILFAFFLLLFPKGGIKVGGIPFTWGYLFLGFLALYFSFRKRFVLHPSRLRCLLMMIPFQVISLFTLASNGVIEKGYAISFLISFFFLPPLFFLLLSDAIEKMSLELFIKMLRGGILFLAGYGILLFIYRVKTGQWIEIPFLTVNYHDLGELDSKYIDRGGGFFKLISTYNNGNIFGVCILMLMPLYNLIESSTWRKLLVKLALLMTISRTVWIGLFFSELLFDFMVRKGNRWIKYKFLFIFTLGWAFIYYLLSSLDLDIGFLLDRTLGNRINQLEFISTSELFSTFAFDGIYEIIYMGILKNFGWLGLSSFLITVTGSLWIHFFKNYRTKYTPFEKALRAGIITYLFVSLSDGALMFIPTMAFFWFLSTLLQRNSFSYQVPGRRSVSIRPNSVKYSKLSITN